MIFANSRYVTADVVPVVDSEGNGFSAIYNRRPLLPQNIPFIEYMIKEGDRLDLLAAQFFNDSTQWWRIALANPEFFYPDTDLVPGSLLKVPRTDAVRHV